MAEGEGLIKGGGRPTTYSQVRASKVRKYGRRLDIRSVMRPYLESTDPVRSPTLCRSVAVSLRRKLKSCPPFIGSLAIRKLKTVQSEDHLEVILDMVWTFAEEHRILLIS